MRLINQHFTILVVMLLVMTGCETAYYSLNEQFGRLKNDILVDRVEEAVDAQEEARDEFKSAFEQFEAVVGVPDSNLKSVYQNLSGAFADAQGKADAVSSRVAAVEDVSADLFAEWADELEQISNASLQRKSRDQLSRSKRRYADLIRAMKKAESRMQPVLTSFSDHVLFLKHNLNAQSIAALKGELGGIESNVGKLIADMEKSIDEAQQFLQTMDSN